MILMSITDSVSTFYVHNIDANILERESAYGNESGGWEIDGQFYEPSLIVSPAIGFSGEALSKPTGREFVIKSELGTQLSTNELDITVYVWDERSSSSKILYLIGKANLASYNSFSYTYEIALNKRTLQNDLLSAAPDIKSVDTDTATYNDGRVYPIAFGYVKHSPFYQLAINGTGYSTQGYANGEATEIFEAGQAINYSQTSTTLEITYPPVYGLTVDIDGNSGSVGNATGKDISKPVQAAVTIANTNIPESVSGTDYICYVTDSTGETFKIDTAGNMTLRGSVTITGGSTSLDNISDGTTYKRTTANQRDGGGYGFSGLDSSGNVKRVLNGALLAAGSASTGLNMTSTYIGYYNGTTFKVYIKSDGTFYFEGDSGHYLQWDGANLIAYGADIIAGGFKIITGASYYANIISVIQPVSFTTVSNTFYCVTGISSYNDATYSTNTNRFGANTNNPYEIINSYTTTTSIPRGYVHVMYVPNTNEIRVARYTGGVAGVDTITVSSAGYHVSTYGLYFYYDGADNLYLCQQNLVSMSGNGYLAYGLYASVGISGQSSYGFQQRVTNQTN